jgi:hypothetical protein
MMKNMRSVVLGSMFVFGAAATPVPALADGDDFVACMIGCSEAVAAMGNDPYRFVYGRMCRANCVEWYDG